MCNTFFESENSNYQNFLQNCDDKTQEICCQKSEKENIK